MCSLLMYNCPSSLCLVLLQLSYTVCSVIPALVSYGEIRGNFSVGKVSKVDICLGIGPSLSASGLKLGHKTGRTF